MKFDCYSNIIRVIKHHKGLSRDCLNVLKEKFPSCSTGTLWSIISHEYNKRMKINHIKTDEVTNKYYELYTNSVKNDEKPGILLKIAEDHGVTPCLVARLILQKFLEITNQSTENDEFNSHVTFKTYLRDTTLIPDGTLAYEIYLCTLHDDLYSPAVDVMKMNLGQEYEIRLHREMAQLGLAFRDEEYMRKYGYDKTPDVKLEVPFAVDGFIVNWVESKALFGDETVHKEYMHNQYLSYWNRFGSGLIIYWFDFLETIVQPNDKKFMIRDQFPTNITHLVQPKLLTVDDFNLNKENSITY